MSSDELGRLAGETGERLVADLARAELLSAGWTDCDVGYALLSRAMDRCLARLAATECWGKRNQLPSGELWTAAGAWLDVSWLQHQARIKPRGYAGDFEMFDRFWRRACCEHPLGRLFDRYFQCQAAVEAVRGRTEQLAASLVERGLAADPQRLFHVASVGCGPAIELALAAQALAGRSGAPLKYTLLDLDEAALVHAQQRLSPWLAAEQIVVARENLYRLADRPRAAVLLDGVDFVCCSGLFDYLPDDAAQKLLRFFWERLRPGGMLTVGNFAPHNPTRAYMEWIGNWYLLYRTSGDLARLAKAGGIPETSFTIGTERLGIDLFLEAVKA
ncbi:MAG TPA: class I SAM-dependent methyltransferase [Pirellulales bacterium]|nr:class I SAM-dependent methyltransferase [Pirellulales bacterium]